MSFVDNTIEVAVSGGTLRAGQWGESGPAVLALHGVTANHLCWAPTARRLAGMRVLAPDLRGRGGSNRLPGPYGIATHADDAAAVLDAQGISNAIVIGHSMGGFVALALAHRHPDKVSGLVLVDGGPPIPLPRGIDPDAALESVIGAAARRLTTTYPNREAYLEEWRAHPAMADWNADIERYVEYDLDEQVSEVRSACSLEAVRADSVDLATGTTLSDALEVLRPSGGRRRMVPLLRAPAGLMAEPGGLYPPEVVATWDRQLPALRVATVPGVNHYTILLGPAGADAVAAAVQQELAGTGRADC